MDRIERRRQVRMKPLPEFPAHAYLGSNGEKGALPVSDVSIGGMALETCDLLRAHKVNDRLEMRISLARYGEHQVVAVIRYMLDSVTGIQFVDLTPEATTALRRYVAELLERGALS